MASLHHSCVLALTVALGHGGGVPNPAHPGPGDQERVEDAQTLFERARARGDSVRAPELLALAGLRSYASFRWMQVLAGELSEERSLRPAYAAFSCFKGTPFEAEVVAYLEERCFVAAEIVAQREAVRALTLFPDGGRSGLRRVLADHVDRDCRALALDVLLPELARRGDVSALSTILENASVEGDRREAVAAALELFPDRDHQLRIAGRLSLPSLTEEWRVLLIENLAHRNSAVAREALASRLADESRRVRRLATKVLGEREGADAVAYLRREIEEGDEERVADAVEVLIELRSTDPRLLEELYSFTRSRSLAVRMATARALADLPTRGALDLLHRMLRDDDWRVQMLAARSCVAQRRPESIPRLIELLGVAGGRLKEEVLLGLRLLTGIDQGTIHERWQAWFEGEGATLRMPTLEDAMRAENEREARRGGSGRTAAFYGLRITSDRVCFVLDTSGSMKERATGEVSTAHPAGSSRLDVAKYELRRVLEQLFTGVRFNVVQFASEVTSFRPAMTPVDEPSRNGAIRFVREFSARGGTNLYGALMFALQDPEVDTLYVLTDGEPSGGAIDDIREIRRRVAQENRIRMVQIHGVAVGMESRLLKWLAEDSGGHYRRVD